MEPSIKWKTMKRSITSQSFEHKLKSLDPKSVKNLQNAHGKTLLHVAAKHAILDISKYLIEAGLDVNLEEKKNGHTPLSYALNCNDKERKKIVDLLVKFGADVSWTKIRRHIKIFKNPKTAASLFCALKSREGSYQAAADHLLDMGWSLDSIVICLQNEIITKYALSRDHMLTENYEKLKDAISQQDVLKVKEILQFVSHSKRILSWALMEATRIRSPQSTIIIKLLLDYGAPVDGFTEDKKSPLMEALINRNDDNTWILLDYGAKVGNDEIPNHTSAVTSGEDKNKERVFAKNCIRLIIEYAGPLNCENLKPGFPRSLNHFSDHEVDYDFKCGILIKYLTCKEYELMKCHSTQTDENIQKYLDCSLKMALPIFVKEMRECNEELTRMKKHKVEKNVTLWDLLVKKIDDLIPFTRNDCLIHKINSKNINKEFPHYGETLLFKINKALEKRLMIDHSVDVLSKSLPLVSSCLPGLNEIVSFLGVPNLLSLE